jgi:hypothetical protein
MAHRTVHGTAKRGGAVAPALETLPYNEQPLGEPAQADDASRTAATEAGPFAEGNKRSVLGGRAHRGKPRMVERVSLTPPAETLPTRRYHVAARALAKSTARTIASVVGGGQLDPHTGYLITAGARAAKWANYYSDLAERLPEGSKVQRETVSAALSADEKASSHLRNAHEYAARMAEARANARKANPAEQLSPFYQAAAEAARRNDDDGESSK